MSQSARGSIFAAYLSIPVLIVGSTAVTQAEVSFPGSAALMALGAGLALQPWGEQAFHAVLLGYQFVIAAEEDEPRLGLSE